MNNNLEDEINNLKERIYNEIETLRYYDELNYACDKLLSEVNNYEYDSKNNMSLKKYKAYLENFLEQVIGYINTLIVSKNNDSFFDNRDENDLKNLDNIKQEISLLLTYINNNFPILGEGIREEYERINDYYSKQLEYAINSSKKRFNIDINVMVEPLLSLYSDTSSVIKSYINSLTHFKTTSVDSIKIFIDNDLEVKALFIRAYATLKDPIVIEAINKLESNYYNEINKCMAGGRLYANDNILLIQENMILNGLQLDRIINHEKEKNYYYNLLLNMNFNYDENIELLKIEKYVNENNIYVEEFYSALYGLIEKEKYLNIKYGIAPKIYNLISDKSRIYIEKMFLNRLKNMDKNGKEEVITSLKKNGYINTLDLEYEELFDNNEFMLNTTYNRRKITDTNTLQCKYITSGILERHFNISNIKTGKVHDRVFVFHNTDDTFVKFGDIYRFSGEKIKSIGNSKPIVCYYDLNGKKIKPFNDDSKIINRIFDLYIVVNDKGKMITDKNFKKIFDYDQEYSMLVDYRKENIILFDNNKTFYLYDKEFNKIKSFKINDILADDEVLSNDYTVSLNDRLCSFNDGIVSMIISANNKKYIYYYDVINMKKIDSFIFLYSDSLYGYSEGLYNFCDDVGHLGYKNLNGEVVIKPRFMSTFPFLSGCAFVDDYASRGKCLIDYQGNVCSLNKIVDKTQTEEVKPNFQNKRYETNRGYYIAVDKTYKMNCDDRIIDINLKEKEKQR